MQKLITLDGITYQVIRQESAGDMEARGFMAVAAMMRQNGVASQLALRRPKGTRIYHANLFTSGAHSAVIAIA
jgi:hypothetical protein